MINSSLQTDKITTTKQTMPDIGVVIYLIPVIYVNWCLIGHSTWVSSRQSCKWLKDYEIGYSKDQAP